MSPLQVSSAPFKPSPLRLHPASPHSPLSPLSPIGRLRYKASVHQNPYKRLRLSPTSYLFDSSPPGSPGYSPLSSHPLNPTAHNYLTVPPPYTPAEWKWRCHQCSRDYPLGVTRRCLDDGHIFCSGGMSSSNIGSGRSGRSRRRKSRKANMACSSEFDYEGWKEWDAWRRTEREMRRKWERKQRMKIPPTSLASKGLQHSHSRCTKAEESDEGSICSTMTDEGYESGSTKTLQDYNWTNRPHGCADLCDYPSECRWVKHKTDLETEREQRAGYDEVPPHGLSMWDMAKDVDDDEQHKGVLERMLAEEEEQQQQQQQQQQQRQYKGTYENMLAEGKEFDANGWLIDRSTGSEVLRWPALTFEELLGVGELLPDYDSDSSSEEEEEDDDDDVNDGDEDAIEEYEEEEEDDDEEDKESADVLAASKTSSMIKPAKKSKLHQLHF